MTGESGLVHTAIGMVASVNNVTQAGPLLYGQGTAAFGDAAYPGVDKRKRPRDRLGSLLFISASAARWDLANNWAWLLV